MKLNFHDEVRLHELIKKLEESENKLAEESLYFIELLIEQNNELVRKNEVLEEADAKRLNNTYMW